MRRSSRLRNKPKKDYSFEGMWNNMIKRAGTTWNEVVEILDDREPRRKVRQKPKPKPKSPVKSFKPVQKFRKRLPAKKKGPPKDIVRKKATIPKIVQDEKEIDLQPEDRVQRILQNKKQTIEPPSRRPVSQVRKRFLFMLPGDEKILQAVYAIQNDGIPPPFAQRYRRFLKVEKGRLYWTENDRGGILSLPFGMQDEIREAVKKCYFDPRQPSTIEPITHKLRWEWANVTKKVVTRVLRSLETYQLNFARRRPPDIKNRMFMYAPGMLAMDMFFPSKKDGWEQYNCLACMDTWSRYVGLYAINTKRKADVIVAMKDFLSKFAAQGHMPRRILADKGSDMRGAYDAMEPYRQAKDGDKPLVLHTATGTPVLIVEGLNAQVQRRMAVFRTSGLIDSPAHILHEIAEQLNNEPRQARGGLTPMQLLRLDKAGRDEVNQKYRDRYVPVGELPGLPKLNVGDRCRLLKMTRKEQETNKLKGFTAKWSKKIYVVQRKTKLRKNPFMHRYDIGKSDTFYRHELLRISGPVDTQVPQDLVRFKEVSIGDEYVPGLSDEEWEHD